jgi:hypothetical protein
MTTSPPTEPIPHWWAGLFDQTSWGLLIHHENVSNTDKRIPGRIMSPWNPTVVLIGYLVLIFSTLQVTRTEALDPQPRIWSLFRLGRLLPCRQETEMGTAAGHSCAQSTLATYPGVVVLSLLSRHIAVCGRDVLLVSLKRPEPSAYTSPLAS